MQRLRKVVDNSLNGVTLLSFLRSQFSLKAKTSCRLIEEGKVSIVESLAAKGKVSSPLFKLSAGDTVQLDLEKLKDPQQRQLPKLKILYKDDHLLALRKPAGLAVHGGSKTHESLDNCIHEYQFDKDEPPRLVHRLDKDTSGVLLLARTKEMAQILGKYFKEPEKYLKKIYLAMLLPHSKDDTVSKIDCGIVHRIETGIFTATSAHGIELSRITKWDQKDPFTNTGQKVDRAVTDYVYLGSTKSLGTMALFSPITGRKHQIRVHAAQSLGRAIVGDYKYGIGVGNKIRSSLPGRFPMMLHLRSIILKDYFGKELEITAEFEKDFQKCTCATGMDRFNRMPWPEIQKTISDNISNQE